MDPFKLNQNVIWFSLWLPLLYAETHYRFKYVYSYLFQKEPEIIADLPSRMQSGQKMPLLLIIKDADKYPLRILSVTVYEAEKRLFKKNIKAKITSPFKEIVIPVDIHGLSPGQHNFAVKIEYKINNKHKICLADNYRGTNHQPFPVYISEKLLPRLDNCFLGDVHCHSIYSSDQVEFGAGLAATSKLARSMGLDFICVTDHSYDLDDYEDNFLLNDPNLQKWASFLTEVHKINQEDQGAFIIHGEEVTVRNVKDKNVHILVYNTEKYYPGSGDSAEKWFRNRSEYSIADLCADVTNKVLLFAAHPADQPPFLQRLLINRDRWHQKDLREKGLQGMQFINGGEDKSIRMGKQLWIKELLDGYRPVGLAGNDAHGNFARFRQIGLPFFTMREHQQHVFGKWRTGVYLDQSNLNSDKLLQSMKKGNCYMTNGPALKIQLRNSSGHFDMGEECKNPISICFETLSTAEYSDLDRITLILGDFSLKHEKTIYVKNVAAESLYIKKNIPFKVPIKSGYIRMEVRTKSNSLALSNPVWFTR